MKADAFRLALAETLLSAIVHPAQAASIAGDLIETHRQAGGRFSRDLLSTLLGLSLHCIAMQPLRSTGALAVSALLWSVFYLAVRVALAGLGWLSMTTRDAECLLGGGPDAALLAASLVLAGFATGAVLGSCTRHGPVGPALPLAASFAAAFPVIAIGDFLNAGLSWHCALTYLVIAPLCYVAPLLLGAALAGTRRRSRRLAD